MQHMPIVEPCTASSNNRNTGGSLKRGLCLNHHVFCTFIRSHPIDQCIQADLDETNAKKGKQESISEEEIHEFNILIVVMTVHNNKLKDEFSSGSLRQEKKDSN